MMRTFGRIGWICMVTIVAGLALASCGNSQKSKVQSGNQAQQPAGAVIEESEVVVEVDSIAPDSTAVKVKK
ncbi:hypothetical protein AALK14_04380 [Butyricimonas hominis]|uniref:Uncharacterized protein n=1 Tax=Butyricimonas hominis TaxID=2763032 RepID=A0ABR7D6S3_9BACT|nr:MULTISPECIES: hypothetical protein [Butyricimonas]MBC5623649.1 hypothetical protein [Butyricimonas hominis]